MRIKIKKVSDPSREYLIGTEFDVVKTKTIQGQPYVFVLYQGKELALPHGYYDIVPGCQHDFIIGFINTWCKNCDAEGYYQSGNLIITKHSKPSLED